MKVLLLHVDYVEWRPTTPALRSAEPASKDWDRVEDALLVMVAVEEGDSEEKVSTVLEDIEKQYERIRPKKIVIYPWVHLTQRPSKPSLALTILNKMFEGLRRRGYDVYRAPFGWYKALRLSIKGHPLAELSRSF